jgi:hypothetical protein
VARDAAPSRHAEQDAWAFAAQHPQVGLTTVLPAFMLGPIPGDEISPSMAMVAQMLTTSDTLWMLEMAALLRAHLGEGGAKAPTQELPDAVVRQAAAGNAFLREMLAELGVRRTFSAAKAQRLLGWRGRPAAEVVRGAADSLIALELTRPAATTEQQPA